MDRLDRVLRILDRVLGPLRAQVNGRQLADMLDVTHLRSLVTPRLQVIDPFPLSGPVDSRVIGSVVEFLVKDPLLASIFSTAGAYRAYLLWVTGG